MSISIVYLTRGMDGGARAADAFFESYCAHPAGRPHELSVIAKGWDGVPGRERLEQQVNALSARIFEFPDDGFDWGAYIRLAPLLSHDWLCFLNTHSRIVAEGWLDAMMRAAEDPAVGVAGATGSWGSVSPGLSQDFANLADLLTEEGVTRTALRGLYYLGRYLVMRPFSLWSFPSFPNPHLRSNAFLLRRGLFLDYISGRRLPVRKRDAFRLESGRDSLSRFVMNRGLKPVVVARDGKVHDIDHWAESGTFRNPGQPNLLISDNQTRNYDCLPRARRRISERAAWGRALTP